MNELIVAPITASGGAVAVLRLDGAGAWATAAALCTAPYTLVAKQAVYVRYDFGEDGLMVPFEEGHSYTGSECVELSCHGSLASLTALIEACLAAGARLAEPGEFTLRAFMNGKMDLTQAEGVRATVEAKTAAQLRQGTALREGVLGECVHGAIDCLTKVLTAVEASVDFSEEVGEVDTVAALAGLYAAAGTIRKLLDQSRISELVTEGVTVAICGRPNAGKSSLLNALLNEDRAIVTPIAGTTRDLVQAECQIKGYLFKLVDTAGLRETEDAIERIGITKTHEALARADLILYLVDSTIGPTPEDRAFLDKLKTRHLVVYTKRDLNTTNHESLAVSSTTGEGLDELIDCLLREVHADELTGLTLRRHEPLLREAGESVWSAIESLQASWPTDLITVHLRSAIRCLGEITGETASPDILHQIFSTFCIGK